MKIGIDCHNLEGQRTGVGRYLWNLLKEWTKLDVTSLHNDKLDFFLYFKNQILIDLDLKKFLNLPFSRDRVKMVKINWHYRMLGCKSNALFKHWLLPRAAAKDKVDVLFCPDYVLPLPFILFSFLKNNIKIAVTIHDIIYEARPEEYSWPSFADKILLKWASKQSAKKADIIFSPSEFTKNEIIKYYRVNPEKIVVTMLAPDQIFRKIEGQKYGIQDKQYILFVGSIFNRRFLPQKIRGFTIFAKNHPEFRFLIIGKNHTKPLQDIGALAARANKELGREAVIWENYASDEELVYLYNGAFATLWLSSYEGFGLPVLESMACGTPVITSRFGALSEVAGDAALYIENPESSESISEVLDNLVGQPNFYAELSSRGLAGAKIFSWQICAKITIDSILKLW